MVPTETGRLSARRQAELIRKGEVSARELVEASLDAIARLNPALNAFVTVCGDRAREEANAIRPGDPRPLAGVPIAVKDVLLLTAGVRTTMGTAQMADFVPDHDSHLVRRLRAAGAIVVGKTNASEFAVAPVTEPLAFGPTRNPWDLSRNAGGSSGGSACAVASSMVSLATGGDTGGSVRIPAACCGVVGFKSARGRISLGPDFFEVPGALHSEGVLARSIEDVAAFLDVAAGPEIGDPHWPPPVASFAAAARAEPKRLRIGFTTVAPLERRVHERCANAVLAIARKLDSLGHQVEEWVPRWYGQDFATHFGRTASAYVQGLVVSLGKLRGAPLDLARLEPGTRAMAEKPMTAAEYLSGVEALRRESSVLLRFWDDHDVMLTPTLTAPAPLVGQPPAPFSLSAFLIPWNVTGQPAVSLPVRMSEGLPVGVQLVGPPAGEECLLSLSAQLERAVGGFESVPPDQPRNAT